MREVFVTGGSGMVGSRFIELYSKKYKFTTPEYPNFDITSQEKVKLAIENASPEVLINFAAFTDVGAAESQRNDKNGSCWKINVDGVKNLAYSSASNILFIQISTDMVFSGSKENPGPYSENNKNEDNSDKLTWYGYTKAQGEEIVLKRKNSAILRIIYPVRAKYELKQDYLRRPLALFDQGKLYPMFNDQQVSFAFVDEICIVLDKIIEQKANGVFHASSNDTSTPYEVISYLLEKARGVRGVVKSSSLKDFLKTVDNPVRYPEFGGLKVESTEKRLGIKFSSWKEIIDTLIDQKIS